MEVPFDSLLSQITWDLYMGRTGSADQVFPSTESHTLDTGAGDSKEGDF